MASAVSGVRPRFLWAPLSLRIARRELRGGLKGFRVFLVCLALGVAAIAGVGSLSEALVAGLNADAQLLLGGDVELRLTHRAATPEQLAWLQQRGRLSSVVEMRAMARAEDGRRSLVELKAVDGAYPLYGALRLAPAQDAAQALENAGGVWGAAAEPALLRKLGLKVGDPLKVGEATYVVRAEIAREPDRGADAFVLGPRLMVAAASLPATGLVQEGSLIRYAYRLALPSGASLEAFTAAVERRFPDAGWRLRDVRNGAPSLRTFLERMRLFLTLVGLSALLVGGVGVANAVKAYLDGRTTSIAILKGVGAPAGLVFRAYLAQVMALALLGVAAGLAVGVAAPLVFGGLLRQHLPFEALIGIYPAPLLLAAAFGLLSALAFSLWPLARAREVSAAALLRDVAAPTQARPRPVYLLAIALAFAALAGLAVATAERKEFAAWFVVGAAGAFALFTAAAHVLMRLARKAPRLRRPDLRLALANLHRPGAPTLSVVLSFGLGLSVLVAVALIEGNLARQVSERIPASAPAFFFIDIQPDQVERFEQIARASPGVSDVQKVPSLRGRIVAVNGVPADKVTPAPNVAWVLRGDRGLTYAAAPPENAEIVAGEWWPADYSGPPLISLDAEAAAGLGLGLGDALTLNVLGREITGRIANLRRIDWTSFGINFVIIFAPGALEGAPHTYIATARAEPAAETPLETAVTDAFPNVTAIRVREALEAAHRILANVGLAVRGAAGVTLLAGVLVLGGAVAAGHRRRVYDAVVLKVLGARRWDVLRAYALEYLILGAATAALADLVGSLAAWVVVVRLMEASWIWLPGTVAATTAISLVVTLVFGLGGAWAALGQKPAPLLRN